LSIFSLFFCLLYFINVPTTFIDRIMIYCFPIQLVFFAKIHSIFKEKNFYFVKSLIVLLYGIYMYVWFNYSDYSEYWYPYQSILSQDIFLYIR